MLTGGVQLDIIRILMDTDSKCIYQEKQENYKMSNKKVLQKAEVIQIKATEIATHTVRIPLNNN